jgi:hypothetical protein
MKQALIALVLVSSTGAFASTWCHIGTTLVLCPKPPVTHAHEVVDNLQIALEVR